MKFLKHPFTIFGVLVSALVASSLWFIQSQHFSEIARRFATKYVPENLGIDASFDHLQFGLFPPSVSVENPRLHLRKQQADIEAKRLTLKFRPVQMVSGKIYIDEALIEQGDVVWTPTEDASAPVKKKEKTTVSKLSWDELVKVRVEKVRIKDSLIRLTLNNHVNLRIDARDFQLGRDSAVKDLPYQVSAEVSSVVVRGIKDLSEDLDFGRATLAAHFGKEGVRIDQMDYLETGVHVIGSGRIDGNLLNPSSLPASLQIAVDADTQVASQRWSKILEQLRSVYGQVKLKGELRADFVHFLQTVNFKGDVSASTFRWQKAEFDQIKIKGDVQRRGAAWDVNVAEAVFAAPERERRAPQITGSGGKIKFGQFHAVIGGTERVMVPIQLENVHIHTLSFAALNETFPLDFRATGKINLDWTPTIGNKPWQFLAELSLKIPHFQLDNQKLGQTKPLNRVLSVDELELLGGVRVTPKGIFPDNLGLNLPHTKIRVNGQVTYPPVQYGLEAQGDVDLADLGKLAETPIFGRGKIQVKVHGPSEQVYIDFMPDVAGAEYITLKFGDLKDGIIRYDDHASALRFLNVKVERDSTLYTVDGDLDFSGEGIIRLDARFPKGRVEDINTIFSKLTSPQWWYPSALRGATAGAFKVSGGIDLKKLLVQVDLKSPLLDFYGERFQEVTLKGSYDGGAYHLTEGRARKGAGQLAAKMSLSREGIFDWQLKGDDLVLTDLDHVAQLDIPVRGQLKLESTGKGTYSDLESKTAVQVGDVKIRGMAYPPSKLQLVTSHGIMSAQGVAAGGQATVDLLYNYVTSAKSYFRGEAHRLDLSPLLLILNSGLAQDVYLSAGVSGALNLAFQSGSVERGTGRFSLTELYAAKSGSRFQLLEPVEFRIEDGSFNLEDLAVRADGGVAHLLLRSEQAKIAGMVLGKLDLGFTEFLTGAIQSMEGAADLDYRLSGTLKEPLIRGNMHLRNAILRVKNLETPFDQIRGTINLDQNRLTVERLESELAGGRANLTGSVELFANRVPRLELAMQLTGNRLKIFPFQYMKANGRILVTGEELPYLVHGSVFVENGLIKESFFQRKEASIQSARYFPKGTSKQEGDSSKFNLGLDVSADRGVFIKNEILDAEVKAKLKVVNTIDTPRVVGTAEVIQGHIIFKDRQFQIVSGEAMFDNPYKLNPKFNMTAVSDVNNVKVQAYAAGDMEKWKIDLTSQPFLSESEIITLLTMGVTQDEIKKLKAGDQNVVEQGQAASLVLHSLDFNRGVQEKTGLQVQLQESVNSQTGTSIFRPQAQAESVAAPKIVIKRQVGKNVDLSLGSTVGAGTGTSREVNAEVKVTNGFSVLGVWNSYEGVDTDGNRTSYGVDLKVQKRFK